MSEEKYKFSVVIPIYNVEEYLRETIESVLAQDIGFVENIQMILVNDGSPDDSETICLEYQEKYPQNIIYVKQENAGVSAARNHGMDYVEGKYVNFLDSDDKWSVNAFSEVYAFFEKYQNQIDVVSCKQQFFEASTGLHPLSKGKYGQNRVIDILYDYDKVQFHITATFIKASAMRMASFSTDMRYGEDARYVTELILHRHKYGVVARPTHYYRKRKQNNSAVQGKEKSLEWYLDTPRLFYRYLAELSITKFGTVIPYVQYAICYDIQWRLANRIAQTLTEEQQEEYIGLLRELLLMCDDDIILAQKGIGTNKKICLLSIKYGRDIVGEAFYMDHNLIWNNLTLCNLIMEPMFRVDILTGKEGKLILSGRVYSPFVRYMKFYVKNDSGKCYPIELREILCKSSEMWRQWDKYDYVYDLSLPLENVVNYRFYGMYQDKYEFSPIVTPGKFAGIYDKYPNAYTEQEGYMITKRKNVLEIRKTNHKLSRNQEKLYVQELKREAARTRSQKVKQDVKEVLWYRKAYFCHRMLRKKKIWLVSDRIHVAGDNGEAFFRYLMQRKEKDIEPYFVIAKDSKDYDRIAKIGKVIEFGSRKHKLYTLLADKIISSQGEDHIFNPFYGARVYVKDLCHFNYVFLQHGITKDDLSAWLHKYNKNIELFVAAAKPEWKSIVMEPYYCYTEKDVKLTGFPRYDNLVQKTPVQKSILFMPTWRQELSRVDAKTGEQQYNPEFKNSEYFLLYDKLINDERIVNALKRAGYTGRFFLHNNLMANIEDFHGNDVITVSGESADYTKEFVENALLVTDYSSVAFDFAYLRKPVIYIQHDREQFFHNAVYDEGYFDYATMGFGPVCYDYETAVKAILDMVEQDCRMEECYQNRLEDFYYKFDQNNCQRVYEAIRAI